MVERLVIDGEEVEVIDACLPACDDENARVAATLLRINPDMLGPEDHAHLHGSSQGHKDVG